MKIDLEKIDKESFNVKSGIIAGEECFLITPKELSIKWTQGTKHLRSSIWNKNGELVSASFPKFSNWGENEENFPLPKSLENTRAVEKIDGSLLCLSFYKNEAVIRSRGTFDFYKLENGHEIDILKQKYPKVFGYSLVNPCFSYLYEFVTPSRKIIIDYPEPDIYLIGAISHCDYSLVTQKQLDDIARDIEVKRPNYYTFNSIIDMLVMVKDWKNKEGIVLYSNNDSDLHKIKSADYLKKHYFKSTCNLNSLLDLYFEWDYPDIPSFRDRLGREFDFECLKIAESLIKDIETALYKVMNKIMEFGAINNENKRLIQKDYANLVLTKYKEDSSYLFQLRGKGELDKKSLRKLMERELENK